MLKWEDRLRLIEESPYYEISLSELRVGLKCEYCINWLDSEWTCSANKPEDFRILKLSRSLNIDSNSLKFIPHIITEEDISFCKAMGEVYIGLYRGIKEYRVVENNKL